MMKHTDEVIEYLRTHPQSSINDIAASMGFSRSTAKFVVYKMRDRRLVTTSMSPDRPREVLFSLCPQRAAKDLDMVLVQARQWGGPFGIVMAQVVA